MTKKKRHTAAEIATKLGKAQALSAAGRTQPEIAKALGISVMTFHRWRRASHLADVTPPGHTPASSERSSRVAELELENVRLRKLVTDLLLEKMKIEDEQQRLSALALKKA